MVMAQELLEDCTSLLQVTRVIRNKTANRTLDKDAAPVLEHKTQASTTGLGSRNVETARAYCTLMSHTSSSFYPDDISSRISELFAKQGGAYMPQGNGFSRLQNASYLEQMGNLSGLLDGFGYKNLSCPNIYAAEDPHKVIAEFHFSAWAEQNGSPISGTHFDDVTDLVILSFDGDGKIVQYDDWWDPYVSGKLKKAVTKSIIVSGKLKKAVSKSTVGRSIANLTEAQSSLESPSNASEVPRELPGVITLNPGSETPGVVSAVHLLQIERDRKHVHALLHKMTLGH